MRLGIVRESAEKAGRDPLSIEVGTTIERPLPTTDAESETLLEHLAHLREHEITHFTMDFGHLLTRHGPFAEQVIDVMSVVTSAAAPAPPAPMSPSSPPCSRSSRRV